jgi:hypothetical protein
MLVTTSRDPSAKARRFGKALASFLSIPYVNRGKQSPAIEETWLVVVEDHGNPNGLVKRFSGNEDLLTFKLSEDPVSGRLKRIVPVVLGGGANALKIAQFFELERRGGQAAEPKRALIVASGRIDFVDEGQIKFRLIV